MRPLLQHASRSLTVNPASVALSSRLAGRFLRQTPSIRLKCQQSAASTSPQSNHRAHLGPEPSATWLRRPFSSSTRWLEDRRSPKPNDPVPAPIPSPALGSRPKTERRLDEQAPGNRLLSEGRDSRQEGNDTLLEKESHGWKGPDGTNGAERFSSSRAREPTTSPKKDDVADVTDNIARVPDEHLPSHRERQRWDLSKRFSELMDELLPKLAVVTQKVNTYTGTDYSGVEALRREIKEQENLVKARRAAIDTAKQVLDTAQTQQASAQKEVVALLERKHSWSNGDLERYMSLIRSEHINDQAVNEAKEAVFAAESALEEARTQLEKRERAQYHEEQIWSDTIRRNSTWVTFGLMGVNIFLLLLSLLILEPWRRRRIVREIKSALEAQKSAMEAVPTSSLAPVTTSVFNDIIAVEAETDKAIEVKITSPEYATSTPTELVVEEFPAAGVEETTTQETILVGESIPEGIADPTPNPAVFAAARLTPSGTDGSPQEGINVAEEVLRGNNTPAKLDSWHGKAKAIAQDVISERVISMRRIDYTTAILRGAAAGAVITAAIIAMLRSN